MPADARATRRYLDSVERRSAAAQRFAMERTEESARDYLDATLEEAGAREALFAKESDAPAEGEREEAAA